MANAAFVGHPSRQVFTVDEVEWAHAQPWFDASLIQLVCPATRHDEPVGFVRTRIEPGRGAVPQGGEDGEGGQPGATGPRGELRRGDVALVGVLPEYRGLGLGRALLRWGVYELRSRGAREITLSVEARNERAMSLYRQEGFEPSVEWPHWTRPVTEVASDGSSAGVPSTTGGEAWSGSPSS